MLKNRMSYQLSPGQMALYAGTCWYRDEFGQVWTIKRSGDPNSPVIIEPHTKLLPGMPNFRIPNSPEW